MKKNYLFGMFALAALTMVGCSNDEVVNDYSQDNAIEFGTYVGRDAQSRGTEFDQDALEDQGFGVFAYYTGTAPFNAATHTAANFMKNTHVIYDETKVNSVGGPWTYTPIKYWPNNLGDKVSFFAYAPYNAAYTMTAGTITYTVPTVLADQKDLVWNTSKAIDLTKQNVDDKVKFIFRHALSKIGLKVAAATDEVALGNNMLDENTKIIVKRVMLTGSEVAYASASDGKTETYAATDIFTKTATLDLNNFDAEGNEVAADWTTVGTDVQSYTFVSNDFVDDKELELNSTNSNVLQQLNAEDSYLMIIPQDLSTTGFNVFIEYDVITTDPGTDNIDDSFTVTNRINKSVKIKFESNKQYTLKLILGMTSVKLEAEVSEWGTDDEEVDLPQNNPNN